MKAIHYLICLNTDMKTQVVQKHNSIASWRKKSKIKICLDHYLINYCIFVFSHLISAGHRKINILKLASQVMIIVLLLVVLFNFHFHFNFISSNPNILTYKTSCFSILLKTTNWLETINSISLLNKNVSFICVCIPFLLLLSNTHCLC